MPGLSIGYRPMSCWQNIDIPSWLFTELDSKTILLKKPYTLDTNHRKAKLVLGWNFSFCLPRVYVQEGAMPVYKIEISSKNFPSVKTECHNFYLPGDICPLVKECQDCLGGNRLLSNCI